ncbi:MAG: hypothetical protein K2K93_01910, partial [Muribaculaceae bacterium]|nr:hypothetical protein [Muribaculaceae bacterium]
MRQFISVADIGPLDKALAEAAMIKQDRFAFTGLGRNKTLLMIFFNSSLRTRLSTCLLNTSQSPRDAHEYR